jgi:hypothetical protein
METGLRYHRIAQAAQTMNQYTAHGGLRLQTDSPQVLVPWLTERCGVLARIEDLKTRAGIERGFAGFYPKSAESCIFEVPALWRKPVNPTPAAPARAQQESDTREDLLERCPSTPSGP